jgi:hypothetical protein
LGNRLMVAGEQDFWNGPLAPNARAGVVRTVEQRLPLFIGDRKRILRGARFVSECAGQQSRDGIDKQQRRKFTARHDEVADGNLLEAKRIDGALIDTLIVPTEEQQSRSRSDFVHEPLRERSTNWREENAARGA